MKIQKIIMVVSTIFAIMKWQYIFLSWVLITTLDAQPLITPFESNHHQTATYEECIQFYRALDHRYKQITILEVGPSDISYPISLVVIDKNGLYTPNRIKRKGRSILLINNGIHPGEPEGIDASMMLARDLMTDSNLKSLLDSITIVIVPIFNIGGSMKRNNTSRTNQNGPEFYGFRGNNNYLDLNRDFIKQDSRNTRSLVSIIQSWDPDFFIDTHTTDGADYPYEISLLTGMREKLGEVLNNYIYNQMLPAIYSEMKNSGTEMIPYVEFDQKIEDGLYAFFDRPRFSSGYAALFHTFPFVIETHMLKPFENRVRSTYLLIKTFFKYAKNHNSEILSIRKKSKNEFLQMKNYSLRWKLDLYKKEMISFQTYPTQLKYYPLLRDSMLVYNRSVIISKSIPYYEHYTAITSVPIPDYYVVPQAYFQVIENLQRNGVHLQTLSKDTLISAKYYKIVDYKSSTTPYENHYLHSQVTLQEVEMKYPYYKGDFIVPVQQSAIEYIIQTLEPQGEDSFFAWNFFDGILMRKEYYSSYAFAPIAESILQNEPDLHRALIQNPQIDSKTSNTLDQKLDYIYKNSRFSEPYLQIYPVARIF